MLGIVKEAAMNTVESIEKAVEDLKPVDLARFRAWFTKYDAAVWDIQIKADAASGKLDALAAEAFAEYKNGKSREL